MKKTTGWVLLRKTEDPSLTSVVNNISRRLYWDKKILPTRKVARAYTKFDSRYRIVKVEVLFDI